MAARHSPFRGGWCQTRANLWFRSRAILVQLPRRYSAQSNLRSNWHRAYLGLYLAEAVLKFGLRR
jgi:hypothetical protein